MFEAGQETGTFRRHYRIRLELRGTRCNQDQAHRRIAALDGKYALCGFLIVGKAAESEHPFRWVGNNAALLEDTRGLLNRDTKWNRQRHIRCVEAGVVS